jgi:hypothetical protein
LNERVPESVDEDEEKIDHTDDDDEEGQQVYSDML